MSLPTNKSHISMEPSVVCGLFLVGYGGCAGSAPIHRPSAEVLSGDNHPWIRLSTTGQDLHVLDCNDAHRGVSMTNVSVPFSLSFNWLVTHHLTKWEWTTLQRVIATATCWKRLKTSPRKKTYSLGSAATSSPVLTMCKLVHCLVAIPLAMMLAWNSQSWLTMPGLRYTPLPMTMDNFIVRSSPVVKSDGCPRPEGWLSSPRGRHLV